jgi:hypothetical protein
MRDWGQENRTRRRRVGAGFAGQCMAKSFLFLKIRTIGFGMAIAIHPMVYESSWPGCSDGVR